MIGTFPTTVSRPLLAGGRLNLISAARVLLLVVLFFFPLHHQLIYRVLPVVTGVPQGLAVVWKEALLGLVVLVAGVLAIRSPRKFSFKTVDLAIVGLAMLLAVYVASSSDMGHAVYGFRVFIEPLVAYILARIILRFEDLGLPLAAFYLFGAAIAAWAIFQAAVLGHRFLMDLGYESMDGRLHDSFYIALFQFQRAVGTLPSPNTLGIHCQLVLMLGLYLFGNRLLRNRSLLIACNLVLAVALFYSFSRSSILALVVSLLVFAAMTWKPLKLAKLAAAALVSGCLAFGALNVMAPDVAEPFTLHFRNTMELTDPSTIGHVVSVKHGLEFMSQNPLGIGLGMSGPRASARTGQHINAENSFLVLGFDVGFLGLALYLAILGAITQSLFLKSRYLPEGLHKTFATVMLATLVGQMVAWNLLPVLVELESTVPLFMLLGMADRRVMRSTLLESRAA